MRGVKQRDRKVRDFARDLKNLEMRLLDVRARQLKPDRILWDRLEVSPQEP